MCAHAKVETGSTLCAAAYSAPSPTAAQRAPLPGTRQVSAEWACAEKAPGQSTCEALTALAEAKAVGLLVVGSWGRKGDKGVEVLVRAAGS